MINTISRTSLSISKFFVVVFFLSYAQGLFAVTSSFRDFGLDVDQWVHTKAVQRIESDIQIRRMRDLIVVKSQDSSLFLDRVEKMRRKMK